MYLNTIKPAAGSKKAAKRRGRGIGSGLGKTSGRGHKGQHARSGGYHKVGFEGGQMPLQRRLPKFGFTSSVNNFTIELRLNDLNAFAGDEVTLEALIKQTIVPKNTKKVRVIAKGELSKKLKIVDVYATKGAKVAIEAQGGEVA